MLKNNIEFEDFTDDYLIEDAALYLVDSASGYTTVYGVVYEADCAFFRPANDPDQESSFDDMPDRIAKLFVGGNDETKK